MAPLLALNNISKSYWLGDEEVAILKGIDLQIFAGEMVAIVGQSGSGKSTLMNILALLDVPTAGEYAIDGQLVAKKSRDELANFRAERFGFVFQRYQLLSALTAKDNVALPAIYAGKSNTYRNERAIALLGKLGLGDRLSYYPNQLSGGQQQRVSIARALMNGGQIIFADEPTGALDSQSGQEVMAILRQLNAEGHTVILVTHDPNIAQSARRVITIFDGKIIDDKVNTAFMPKPQLSSVVSQKPKWLGWLNFKEAFLMAFLTMVKNKLRTLLTMLGIIIGIASVMLVVALGNGSKQAVLKDINAMGSPTLTVMSDSDEQGNYSNLTLDDMTALQKEPFIVGVSPEMSMTMTAFSDTASKSVQVEGVGSLHHKLQNVKFIKGAMFYQNDLDNFAQNIVISDRTATTLFGRADPIGKILVLNGVPCQVVGVFAYTGYQASYERTLKAWLPYSTYQMRFAGQDSAIVAMTALLKSDYPSALASAKVKKVLESRHEAGKFSIFNSDSLAKTVEKTAQSLTLLISAIAVISLLVGGIGVMNIMLVSVTERTSEIGIRMAVGASYADIIRQFLIEAVVVCAMGGLLGVAFAMAVGFLLQMFEIPVIFSLPSVGLSVLCAGLIGVIFGYLPARRAGKMNPIDALNNH